MADIRINSLPTTASSSSSDDFLALDGTTNGTRKLNAYSPSFGGNATVGGTLTVSGAGTSTFSGPVAVTAGNYFKTSDIRDGTATADRLVHTSSTTAIFGGGSTWTNTALYAGGSQQLAVNSSATTLAGNLTVSGMGTSSVAGSLVIGGGALSGSESMMVRRATSGYTVLNTDGTTTGGFYVGSGLWVGTSSNHPLDFFTNGSSTLMRLTTSGNLLLGTTTDSANGKLQLATHTTSAGGIGFGTDLSLFRSNSGGFPFYGFPSVALGLSRSSGASIVFSSANYNMYIGQKTDSGNFFISATDSFTVQVGGNASNGTTALTLDSSQNATFAGLITSQSSGGGSGIVIKRSSSPYLDFYDGGTSGTIRAEILADNDGVSGGNFKIKTRDAAGTGVVLAATFDKNQDTILAGKISTSAPTGGAGAWELGVYTATAPTATGYVTIEIGGTQYKLLAATA